MQYDQTYHDKQFKKLNRETGRIHHAALRPAKTRGSGRRQDGIKYKVNNHMSHDYGISDLKKKTITVNKKAHKRDGEKLIDTIVHEKMHHDHPNMTEKAVRKLTPKKLKRMHKRSKARLYAKFN